MYNPKTGGIIVTRDIYWLNKMPNEVKIEKIGKLSLTMKIMTKSKLKKFKKQKQANINRKEEPLEL